MTRKQLFQYISPLAALTVGLGKRRHGEQRAVHVNYGLYAGAEGAWFRAFDYDNEEFWSSDNDWGYGPWVTETGWSNGWIMTALALRGANRTLRDIMNESGLSNGPQLLDVCREMLGAKALDDLSSGRNATRALATGPPRKLKIIVSVVLSAARHVVSAMISLYWSLPESLRACMASARETSAVSITSRMLLSILRATRRRSSRGARSCRSSSSTHSTRGTPTRTGLAGARPLHGFRSS